MGGDYETLHVLHQHTNYVRCMCELSNGYLVSGSSDETLNVWDMNTKTVIHTLTGHSEAVLCVIQLKMRGVADDQILVASGSMDGTIRIWNVTTAQCLRVLKGHSKTVRGVVELSDGTLLSASQDKTIREWDINSAQCVSVFKTLHESWITRMGQLRDGSIITGGLDGSIEIRKTWTNSQQPTLLDLCCQLIAKHTNSKFDMGSLEQCVPSELYELINKVVPITTDSKDKDVKAKQQSEMSSSN
eukprot:TRINITY_DN2604_c0_g1_i1.p1 TRINITY_DN2604_c0_g1~~TRINITY_DN2604_c0_g1_i1.p1  ORF type:complete len:279 (+),score=50.11 TRINITY_DN2604_c0_g1_i1:108-839(+)